MERRTILEMFVWCSGAKDTNLLHPPPPTIQMFANFCNFAELHLFTLNMYDFQTWQFYEILRHPFQWYQWIFPNLFMSKAEKTMKGSITRTNAFGLSDCRYYNYDVQLSQTVQLLFKLRGAKPNFRWISSIVLCSLTGATRVRTIRKKLTLMN